MSFDNEDEAEDLNQQASFLNIASWLPSWALKPEVSIPNILKNGSLRALIFGKPL